MKAMSLEKPGRSLAEVNLPVPEPGTGELLLKVRACGVCRTDLHIVDGDLKDAKQPIVPGHEIIGTVERAGLDVEHVQLGTRLGVPWLGKTCGVCAYCVRDQENLCDNAEFTGYHIDGGYADYVTVDARYCFPIPDAYEDAAAAPLLCAGLIGYRSLRMAAHAERIGIYGFGAAAHIIAQIAHYQNREVYAFTRPGDRAAQEFARELGCRWAGGSDKSPPVELDAAIIFAPIGALIPAALKAVRKGGTVVCGGIHMTEIPAFPYEILWGERIVRSVANLTRQDAIDFLALAPKIPIETSVEIFALRDANEALCRLRSGRLTGAAVLVPSAHDCFHRE